MTRRFLDHTADLGIEAEADDVEELFAECLRALTDCMTRLDRVRSRLRRRLELRAPELSDLLVEFLSEAIYLHETEGLILADAELQVSRLDDGWRLTGEVLGESFDLERHGLKTLLKAVTYHQLAVARREDKWVARVIFDI